MEHISTKKLDRQLLGGNGYAVTVGNESWEQDSHGKQVAQSTLRTRLTSNQGGAPFGTDHDL